MSCPASIPHTNAALPANGTPQSLRTGVFIFYFVALIGDWIALRYNPSRKVGNSQNKQLLIQADNIAESKNGLDGHLKGKNISKSRSGLFIHY
jgi:hypothetical protein